MRKLKLDLDRLAVDTFVTEETEGKRGTVVGHATFRCTTTDRCTEDSCGQNTCFISCDGVCGTYYCVGTYDCTYALDSCPYCTPYCEEPETYGFC